MRLNEANSIPCWIRTKRTVSQCSQKFNTLYIMCIQCNDRNIYMSIGVKEFIIIRLKICKYVVFVLHNNK